MPTPIKGLNPATLPSPDETVAYSTLALGRLQLLAGDPRRAVGLLKNAEAGDEADEQLRSFLLWQASQRLDEAREADFWRRHFFAYADDFFADDREFFEQFGYGDGRRGSWSSSVASTAPEAALQPNNAADLSAVVRHLEKARQTYEAAESLENRIRLATWLLLFGELAGDINRGGFVTRSIDATTEGMEHLDEIEEEITRDPSLEERISKDTAVAIRLDAARVRRVAIERRLALARTEEIERLKQLREVVRAYRDLTQRLSLVHAEYFIEDYDSAKRLNEAALADAARVAEVVQRRRDYFLFSDEPQMAPDADLGASITAPEPFSNSVIAHLKGLHSLLAFRIADKQADQKLLAEAETWALAALGPPQAGAPEGVPAGHDVNCITAQYALALITEAQGALLTAADPFAANQRLEAKAKFEASRTAILHVQELLKGRREKTAGTLDTDAALAELEPKNRDSLVADDAVALVALADAPNTLFSKLLSDVNHRAELLAGPAGYLRTAEEATLKGKPQEAWLILTDGIRRHSDSGLAAAWIDAGRRSDVDFVELAKQFDSAVAAGILNADDPQGRLAFAKLATKESWRQISKVGVGNLEAAVKSSMDADLQIQEQRLREVLSSASKPNDGLRAELQSHLALIIAYRSILMPQPDRARVAEEGYRLAQDAAATAEKALRESQGLRAVELREALVAARLAIGHLAIVALPDYRDECLLAFAAAFDESAKLPVPTANLKSVGSPILTAIMNRPENAAAKMAQEERQQRLLITRFLEAAFTVNFGAAAAASDQMKSALATVPQSTSHGTVAPEASDLLAGADGFEAKAALRDSVRAFQVLTDITAGRSTAALAESCRIVIPDRVGDSRDDRFVDSLDPKVLDFALSRIQSPVVGYAFGSALEAYAEALPGLSNPRRPDLMKAAEKTFSATEAILASPAIRNRYPQLVTLTEDSRRRLTQPAFQFEQGRMLRLTGDLPAAVNAFERGLKRHPRDATLWQAFLETKVSAALNSKSVNPQVYDEILLQLSDAESLRLIPNSLIGYFRGVIYRRQGKPENAAREFGLARENATPEQRVRISAELATVHIHTTSSKAE